MQELHAGSGKGQSVLPFESKQEIKNVSCPYCQGKVYTDGYGNIKEVFLSPSSFKEKSFVL